jgi:hypothetical protein
MGIAYSPFVIPVVAIIAWAVIAVMRSMNSARIRELEIRERIAMIERGLVPPPEVDPGGFERAMKSFDRANLLRDAARRTAYRTAPRHRRAGITLLGVGFGLMFLIGVAGNDPQSGIGVGGFLVILGLAFFVNSLFEGRPPEPSAQAPAVPPPSANRPPDAPPAQ